ncbi:MAG: hypothetical protein KGH65_01360 [Candidatus Micrarchaeota archaeon]|nr:hypothetical protein [Candidatus Micrarchaeota archaeon]
MDLTLLYYMAFAFGLGLVHGITPDEHTWPITFSYSIGAFNTKGGAKAGMFFSLGFTAQRALLGVLAFTALASFFAGIYTNSIVFIIVGLVMSASGFYILRKNFYPHFHALERLVDSFVHIFVKRSEGAHRHEEGLTEHDIFAERPLIEPRKVPLKLAALHGAIAGFGFGAIDLLVYTSIVPHMPSIYYAWIPGALFGIGTLVMQVIIGAVLGSWLQRRQYTKNEITYLSRKTSGRTLGYGGFVFVFAGILIFLLPQISGLGIASNLPYVDQFDLGTLIVVIILVITFFSYRKAVEETKRLRK